MENKTQFEITLEKLLNNESAKPVLAWKPGEDSVSLGGIKISFYRSGQTDFAVHAMDVSLNNILIQDAVKYISQNWKIHFEKSGREK